MDDSRLAAALSSAADTERAIRFHLDTEESPIELSSGWSAYRNVVGLRKALGNWIEMRAARRAQLAVK